MKIKASGPTLTHGDVITIPVRGRMRRFRIGTVVGYAGKYGDSVAVAVARAVSRGNALVWANPEAVVLSATPLERDPIRSAHEVGDVITVDRGEFRIERAPNDNVKLVPAG